MNDNWDFEPDPWVLALVVGLVLLAVFA